LLLHKKLRVEVVEGVVVVVGFFVDLEKKTQVFAQVLSPKLV
jgi:hypothetical protein